MLYHTEDGPPTRPGVPRTPAPAPDQPQGDPNTRAILMLLLTIVAAAAVWFAVTQIRAANEPPEPSGADIVEDYCRGYADRRPASQWDRNFADCLRAGQ